MQNKVSRRRFSACVEELEARRLLSVGVQPAGALAGHVLYTQGGHGIYWNATAFSYMRPNSYGLIEDLGNQDMIENYAQYVLNAGGTLVSMRPVGHQTNEAVVDNAQAYNASTGGFQIVSGTWTNNTTSTPYWSNNDGNDTVHFVTAATTATETAVARFVPNIPAAGFYPVYAWWNPGTNKASTNDRVADQTFRINYSGGSYEVRVAANKVGNGWVYLGDYYFAAGVNPTSGSVEVSNKSATPGEKVVADAIRFGNGMGDWTDNGAHPVSGQPREDEPALYWCYDERGWTGAGVRVAQSVVDAGSTSDEQTRNFSACDRYATYMNNQNVGATTDRVWISFHTNASGSNPTGGAARGTYGLINTSPTANQAWLADDAGGTFHSEMSALDSVHEYAWGYPGANTYTGGYSEISSNVIGTEFDATIIEVAFHDNAMDSALMRSPAVRLDAGRSAYHVAMKYFANFDSSFTNTTWSPEPPVDVRATTDASGNVIVSWGAGPSSSGASGPYGNAATSYLVQTSVNGYGFDGGTSTTGTSLTIGGLSTSTPTYFRVVAVNDGGVSIASTVVVAKPQSGRPAPVLIVNDYSRLDEYYDQTQSTIIGTAYRARTRYQNTFDYDVQVASAISNFNSSVDIESCTDKAIANGEINLSNYAAVIWYTGENSVANYGNGTTAGTTFTSVTQPKVTSYLNGGGKMFVNGAEIGYELVGHGYGSSFYSNTLKTSYVADDAGTYTASGVTGGIFSGISVAFDDGTSGAYNVSTPDKIGASGGSTVAMSYTGSGSGGAAIQYASGNTRIVNMGFPFETITTAAARNQVMAAVLTYFGVGVVVLPGTPANPSPANNAVINVAPTKLDWDDAANATSYDVYLGTDPTPVHTTASQLPLDLPPDGVRLWRVVANNLVGSTNGPQWQYTQDTVAPAASYGGRTPAGGLNSMDFTITYTDATTGLDSSSFDSSDVTVTGPNSFSANAAFVSVDTAGNGSPRTVTYRIAAPGGTWNVADNGTYTVSQNASQVKDMAGNYRSAGSIGTFTANIFAYMSGTTLEIEFDGSATPISVGTSGSNVTATKGTTTLNFPAAGVSAIAALGTTSADTLNWSGPIAAPLTFTGGGGADLLDINSGTYTFNSDVATTAPGLTVNVGAGASAVFNSTQHLAALTVGSGAVATFSPRTSGTKVLYTNTLDLGPSGSPTGTLDLNDNDLVVNNGVFSDIQALVFAGYRQSADPSAKGIVSSTGQTSAGNPILALFDNGLVGSADYPFGSGQTVSANAVVGKYTYIGDTNWDGQVTPDDYGALDANLGATNIAAGTAWFMGDTNFDGQVTPDDYGALDANLGIGVGNPLSAQGTVAVPVAPGNRDDLAGW